MTALFLDRVDAGRRLGAVLRERGLVQTVVLGLPRGGVVVASEVARSLGAPLDVLVVRKLRSPHQPELGIGAVGEGGVRVLNAQALQAAGVDDATLWRLTSIAHAEVAEFAARYRRTTARLVIADLDVVLVDDGIATGGTARAACLVARAAGAASVTLAVPVAPASASTELREAADEFVCLATPPEFLAVGAFYDDFRPITEEQVESVLENAGRAA
jgi:putative phosphoribosyl transferase